MPASSDEARERAARLAALHAVDDPRALLRALIGDVFKDRVAVVSSFGVDSAVLLHEVAAIDRATPVIFLDTGRHFPETLAYRDRLAEHLGLGDLRIVRPEQGAPEADDPESCCAARKAEPLERALAPFAAWISGRKRHQSIARRSLTILEADGARVKINPLVAWSESDLADYMSRHDLPPHPLAALGYRSIGCAPCTTPVAPGESARDGRWRGTAKTECGIHRVLAALMPEPAAGD